MQRAAAPSGGDPKQRLALSLLGKGLEETLVEMAGGGIAGADGGAGELLPRVKGWAERASTAVFRGAVWRLSEYADRWRELGPRRVPVSAGSAEAGC